MNKLYVEREYEVQGDALRLLTLPVLLDLGWGMGPKTRETLERFRDNPDPDEEPMAWAFRVFKFSAPKLKVVQ